MRHKYFISGTDTDVGKTLVSAALLNRFAREGHASLGMKPIAAGCVHTEEGLRNDDALLLQQYSSIKVSYQQTNPVAFEPAIAPHIAAQEENRRVSADQLVGFCRGMFMQSANVTIVEGAGGWLVPLNNQETIADVPKALKLPVILVVSIRLGCINHALLSARSIASDGLTLVGWVANITNDESDKVDENIESIAQRIGAPLLATIPFMPELTPEEKVELITPLLDINLLVK